MGKRVHIVGCSYRCGTTLMKELMVTCFKFDAYTKHERSIFIEFDPKFKLTCSKNPLDTLVIGSLLKLDRNLWVIYMLRDPRDVLSSRSNRNNTKEYWSTLGMWLEQNKAAEKLENHPRFIRVKYEELVKNPDVIQTTIEERISFLEKKRDFSKYHLHAQPAEDSIKALNGLKPITPSSLGQWRNNKNYIKAQVELFGDISDKLIELGYEQDQQWLQELEGVTVDNSLAPKRKTRSKSRRFKKKFSIVGKKIVYLLNMVPLVNQLVFNIRSSARPKKFEVQHGE